MGKGGRGNAHQCDNLYNVRYVTPHLELLTKGEGPNFFSNFTFIFSGSFVELAQQFPTFHQQKNGATEVNNITTPRLSEIEEAHLDKSGGELN